MFCRSISLLLFLAVFTSARNLPILETPNLEELTARVYEQRHLLDNSSAQLDFWLAVNEGDTDAMEKAYDEGADPNDKTQRSGYQPIHLAAAIGHIEALRLLIKYGADVDAQTNEGVTPLHYAANHGDVLVTNMLLSAKAKPDLGDNHGFVALHFASYANQYQFETGTSKIEGGYDSIADESSLETSTITSAKSKSSVPGMGEFGGCVALLIEFNCNVNAATEAKETALHYTPAFDSYEITQQLIAAGADVNAKDQEQETPLHESTAYGAVGVTQLLLINGSDQNAKAENGLTPKEYICRCNTYVSDPTLTQCAPNKCTRDYDKRVLEHIFEVYNGEA